MKRYGVTHRFSTSYHPQTSGHVKNTNRALKRVLEKIVKDNPAIWSRKLDDALWAFRTAYKTPTGTTPYKLLYGKNCLIPFEIEHRVYWALKNYNPDLIAAGEKRMFQLHELDEFRHQAYENSHLYKYKFKQSKLRSRWLGPYMVKHQYPSGYVELYGKDGKHLLLMAIDSNSTMKKMNIITKGENSLPFITKTKPSEYERGTNVEFNQNGPYVRPMIHPYGAVNINGTVKQILEPLSKMTEGNKKQYFADVKVMNYLLQVIPNYTYNSVDACKNAKEMWERIKRLMFDSDVTSHVRQSRLMDEFDKFATKEGESLESVYERLTTLVNIMDCNNIRPISVSINTKFLNCLQPEWSKYVTMVHHNQTRETVSYDMLYYSLVQFKLHVLASAKKAAKNHDPLALIAHSNASSSQSHANSSYSP
ncbi:reverse transcriptase domain-containing protein [Tanacetum coccineum]